MHHYLSSFTAASLTLLTSAQLQAADIQLSPTGPVSTLQQARDAARAEPKPVKIIVDAGTYSLTSPLILEAADSEVTWDAAPGAAPVISGGRTLTDWKVSAGRWECTLPEVKAGKWNFIDLFVNGERRPRPRLPKNGWLKVANGLPPSGKGMGVDFGKPQVGHDQFEFSPGNIRNDWHALSDVEVLAAHKWRLHRLRIAEVNGARVRFTAATGAGHISGEMPTGTPYIVENVKEALTDHGEWYLDRASGVLTYLPKPGETPENTSVVAPVAGHFLTMNGVSRTVFRGLTFAHTLWETPPQGHCFPQAEADVPAAVRLTDCQNCAFENCTITLTGGYGVDFGRRTVRCTLENCSVTHTGAGGIRIGEGQFGTPLEADLARENTVHNCLIAHGGRLHPAAVGVWIGHSPGNAITHCTIDDFYYTGVSLGWSWGYAPSFARSNTVAWCEISNIGHEVLSDMGGIYTLGNGPGNVLRGNHIHHVACRPGGYGGWGLYHDEGSTGFLSEDNIVHDTSSTSFHQHYGRDNIVRNNIFALGREGGLTRSREEDHISFIFEKNIVLTQGAPLFTAQWKNGNYKLGGNLYWDLSQPTPAFPGQPDFAAWQAAHPEESTSRVTDPLFKNVEARDFRLKPGSPALAMGFRPLDAGKAGRQGDQPQRPAVPRAWPAP